jgi:hypothetical protein
MYSLMPLHMFRLYQAIIITFLTFEIVRPKMKENGRNYLPSKVRGWLLIFLFQ